MNEARSDAEILASVPDFITLPGLMKSSAHEEGGERYLYLEASNEDQDHQGEVVLQKALADSSDYFLRHGNIDLSHFTILGAKLGIPNYPEYEIGRPVEVKPHGSRTFVKAQLFRGESAMARNANMVWDSITKQIPAMRWYPSVGGSVLAKSVKVNPKTGDRVPVVEKVRWNNIALDRCPVNATVPEISSAPIGTFAKSMGGFLLSKTLTAGYGTDAAAMTGGAAMRVQSLDRQVKSYWDFRSRMATAVRERKAGANPTPEKLARFAVQEFGLSQDEAAEYVERFVSDLHSGLKKRNTR